MLARMILRSEPRSRSSPVPDAAQPAAVVPAWLRRAAEASAGTAQSLEEAAFHLGAALGALDAAVRRQERWAGAWRQRLALAAAAASARAAGRGEDEAALRDAVLLTRPGDDPGPGGAMLLAWRGLAARPADALPTERTIAAALDTFGLARRAEPGVIAAELAAVPTDGGALGAAMRALDVAARHGAGRDLGPYLADAALARSLGWPHAVPLLAAELAPGDKGRAMPDAAERMRGVAGAYLRAALRALDLSAGLGRRAGKLVEVAPRLRARAAGAVVERLLSDDAVVASQAIPGISDRGLRRLFDRLVAFGAVRELSGRPTFRIYGL